MTPSILLCHIRGVDALALALRKRTDARFVTLHQPGSVVLERAGIEHTHLDAFLSETLLGKVMDQAQTRLKSLANALRNSPALWPELNVKTWTRLAPQMMQLFQRDLPEQMVIVEVMRQLAADHALSLVITPEDVTRDARTAVLAARALGVPSLHVLHGVNSGTIAAHASVVADRFAVYSEHTREHYVSNGVSPDRIVVTGNPAWDVFARPLDPASRERFCERIGFDLDRPILVYAMTGNPVLSVAGITRAEFHNRTTEAVVRAIAPLAARHPDWQFALRPHPSEPSASELFVALARDLGMNSLRIDQGTAIDCVAACDVFACTHSNMGIEAILAGKPVVNVALDNELGDVFSEGVGPLFTEVDAVLWARDADSIAPTLERALLDDTAREELRRSRPASIERFNGNLDGKATDRVCDLALAMAKGAKGTLGVT